MGFQFESLDRLASTSDLIFYAYSPAAGIDLEKLLSFIIPALIASVQTNEFLNESLAILITYLHAWQTTNPTASLPHDITIPLCGLLPSVASAHPDPSVRHQTFRVLSLLLSVADPWLRFHHLVEYTRDSEYPQMRVAAVGLVKDTLIKSLSSPDAKDDPFCSPLFLRSFGPVLFRPDPQDLLSETLTLDEFQETPEPGRLVECLSLYYVVIQRDTQNVVCGLVLSSTFILLPHRLVFETKTYKIQLSTHFCRPSEPVWSGGWQFLMEWKVCGFSPREWLT